MLATLPHTYTLLVFVVILGLIFGASFFYLIWCLFAGTFLKVDWYKLALYMSVGVLVAIITEAFHDTFYKNIFGEYLWIYQIFPIFGGGSTKLAPLAWLVYGYHTYFLQEAFKARGYKLSLLMKGLIPGIDGVPFDMVGNFFALLISGNYFFYYPREELWHLSSWWVIPFYTVSGIIYAYSMRYFLSCKKSWKLPMSIYSIGIICMVVGEFLYSL